MEKAEKAMQLLMFVGLSNLYPETSTSVIAVRLESKEGKLAVMLPPKTLSPRRKAGRLTSHYLLLSALRYTLEQLTDSIPAGVKIHLIYPANNHEIYVEWEQEYKQNQSFSANTKDQGTWEYIVRLIKKGNITLTISDDDSPLAGVNIIENVCAGRIGHE